MSIAGSYYSKIALGGEYNNAAKQVFVNALRLCNSEDHSVDYADMADRLQADELFTLPSWLAFRLLAEKMFPPVANAENLCRYCDGAGKFQVVSSVSDGAWAACFCTRPDKIITDTIIDTLTTGLLAASTAHIGIRTGMLADTIESAVNLVSGHSEKGEKA